MTGHPAPAALVAGAVLCALLATLVGAAGSAPHRRARRLLEGPTRGPGASRAASVLGRWVTAVASALRGGQAAGRPSTPEADRARSGPVRAAVLPQRLGAASDRTEAEEAVLAPHVPQAHVQAEAQAQGRVRTRAPGSGATTSRRRTPSRTDRPRRAAADRRHQPPGIASTVAASGPEGTPGVPLGASWAAVVPRERGGEGAWRAGGTVGRLRARVMRPEAVCVPVGLLAGLATGSAVPVAAGLAAVAPAGRALRRRAERAAAERGATAVGALCVTLAGDLRAGRPPHSALADAVEAAGWARLPELSEAAGLLCSASRFGGDVPEALRTASRLHEGTRGLAAVAACWQVAVDGGAGLAAALDRVAAALRAEADQREDLRAQLAGPRSTAVLLALLPLFGVVLGAGLGANPSRVLLHTVPGLVCLALGVALEWAGLAWTARIIRTAEGGRRKAPGLPRLRGGRIR